MGLTDLTGRVILWRVHVTRVGCGFLPPLAKRLTAIVAVALFLWVTLLAVSPRLHEAFHGQDASSASHQCIATLLSKGQVLVACSVVVVPDPLALVLGFPVASVSIYLSVDYRLSPSRAPPTLLG